MGRDRFGRIRETAVATATDPGPTDPQIVVSDDCIWYTTRQGDTLRSIAARQLGDENRWPDLVRANSVLVPAETLPDEAIGVDMAMCLPDAQRPSEQWGLPQPPPLDDQPALGDAFICRRFLRRLGWPEEEVTRILRGPVVPRGEGDEGNTGIVPPNRLGAWLSETFGDGE